MRGFERDRKLRYHLERKQVCQKRTERVRLTANLTQSPYYTIKPQIRGSKIALHVQQALERLGSIAMKSSHTDTPSRSVRQWQQDRHEPTAAQIITAWAVFKRFFSKLQRSPAREDEVLFTIQRSASKFGRMAIDSIQMVLSGMILHYKPVITPSFAFDKGIISPIDLPRYHVLTRLLLFPLTMITADGFQGPPSSPTVITATSTPNEPRKPPTPEDPISTQCTPILGKTYLRPAVECSWHKNSSSQLAFQAW